MYFKIDFKLARIRRIAVSAGYDVRNNFKLVVAFCASLLGVTRDHREIVDVDAGAGCFRNWDSDFKFDVECAGARIIAVCARHMPCRNLKPVFAICAGRADVTAFDAELRDINFRARSTRNRNNEFEVDIEHAAIRPAASFAGNVCRYNLKPICFV